MADMVPSGLAFQSNQHSHHMGSSRHIGYVVHGQHEVKVAHKCDAFDNASDGVPLTQERKGTQLVDVTLSRGRIVNMLLLHVVAMGGHCIFVTDCTSHMHSRTSRKSAQTQQ